MKKIKYLLLILLLLSLGSCMTVFAEADKETIVRLQKGSTETSVDMVLTPTEDMVLNGVTTAQITIKLEAAGAEDIAQTAVEFSAAVGEITNVKRYTYDLATQELNIYLSSSNALFTEDSAAVTIGTINITPKGETLRVSLNPAAVKTVDQTHAMQELVGDDLAAEGYLLEIEAATPIPPVDPEEPETPENPASVVVQDYKGIVAALENPAITEIKLSVKPGFSLTAEEQKNIFTQLKDTERTFIVEVKNDDGVLYSFKFQGKLIKDPDINVNFEVIIGGDRSDITSLTEKDAVNLVLEFKHNGKLPGMVEFTANVGDTFKDGQSLMLYYFNKDKKALELIQKDVTVVGGTVSIEVDHCSSYVLTTKEVKSAGETPKPGPGGDDGKNPGDGKAPVNQKDAGKDGKAVKTGDSAAVSNTIIIVMAAGVVLLALTKKRKVV